MRGFTRQFHKAHKSLIIFLKSELALAKYYNTLVLLKTFMMLDLLNFSFQIPDHKKLFFKSKSQAISRKMDSTVEVRKLNSHTIE